MNNSNLNPADLKVIFLKKIIAIKLDIMKNKSIMDKYDKSMNS